MATGRKAIRLLPHEIAALKELYLVYRIPIDQFDVRPNALRDFVRDWNARMGRSDTEDDIRHKMMNERKCGRWPKLDGKHKTAPPLEPMTPDEIEILVSIYEEHIVSIGHCSDYLATNPELANLVAKEFAHRARRRLPASTLVHRLTVLRKAGLSPIVGERKPHEEEGFSDIADVAV